MMRTNDRQETLLVNARSKWPTSLPSKTCKLLRMDQGDLFTHLTGRQRDLETEWVEIRDVTEHRLIRRTVIIVYNIQTSHTIISLKTLLKPEIIEWKLAQGEPNPVLQEASILLYPVNTVPNRRKKQRIITCSQQEKIKHNQTPVRYVSGIRSWSHVIITACASCPLSIPSIHSAFGWHMRPTNPYRPNTCDAWKTNVQFG